MKPNDSKINTSSGEPFLISPIEDLSAFDAYPEKGVVLPKGRLRRFYGAALTPKRRWSFSPRAA
jgi:hypothetical protein